LDEKVTVERTIYEESIQIPGVDRPGVFAWQVPISLAVPEELKPGETLAVDIRSEAKVVAQLYRSEPSGASGVLVLSPAPASLLSFEYTPDASGSFYLRLWQSQRYPTVGAKMRIVLRSSRPGGEVGTASARHDE